VEDNEADRLPCLFGLFASREMGAQLVGFCMNYTIPKPIGQVKLFTAVVLALVGMHQTSSAAGMDLDFKWAWSTNAGWINFNPTDGGNVAVHGDHLEGYLWAENVGWIRLGTHTGGSPHTYANTGATNYGVNRNATGHLSGYGWGANVGWINFAPTGGGVTIDPQTGAFAGYAWGENVGWISLKGGSGATAYGVVTGFRLQIYLPLILKP
jgi:hypothetical protein